MRANAANQSGLTLNVGFLLNENIGHKSLFTVDEAAPSLDPELQLSRLAGSVQLTRTPQGLYAAGRLHAGHTAECVRCLAPVPVTLEADIAELYSLASSADADTEFTISDSALLDLAPLVRELLVLDKPAHPLCRAECKGLCAQCGTNLNEAACTCSAETLDPRLAPLSRLKTKED
ncbi:MAG: hypothetical protein RLY92_105 [Chloroflexota bacterium]|jgi:uncharacterized protein